MPPTQLETRKAIFALWLLFTAKNNFVTPVNGSVVYGPDPMAGFDAAATKAHVYDALANAGGSNALDALLTKLNGKLAEPVANPTATNLDALMAVRHVFDDVLVSELYPGGMICDSVVSFLDVAI